MDKAPSNLFRRPFEEINLVSPILLIVLVLAELILQIEISTEIRLATFLLVTLVLGSAGHVGLTYALLVFLPESKQWIHARTEGHPRKFWLETLFVFSCAFTAGLLLFDLLTPHHIDALLLTGIFVFVDFSFTYHHSIAQTHGLMVVYTQGMSHPPSKRNQYWGRNLIKILIGLSIIVQVPYIFEIEDWSLANPFRWTLFLIMLTSVLAYLLLYRVSFFSRDYRQAIFSLRFFLLPLIAFSFFAGVGFRSIHGMEYVFVFDKFFKNSQIQKSRKFIYIIGAIFYLSLSLLGLFTLVNDGSSNMASWLFSGGSIAPWFKIVASFNWACNVTHFYLDRQIFKMRDEHSRRIFGKLLAP